MSGMNTADQVLAYLKVLVWPIIIVFAVIFFQNPIRAILNGLEEFEGFGFKAKIRRQLSQVASSSRAALAASPIQRAESAQTGARGSRTLWAVSVNMRAALRFGWYLVPEPDVSVRSQPESMRQAVDRLDTVIIAVLAATARPESRVERSRWPRMSPPDIERYMVDLTGWMGWEGVIEVRDLLRSTLGTLCGKKGEAVEPAEVILFVTAATDAVRQWRNLVDAVTMSGREQLATPSENL